MQYQWDKTKGRYYNPATGRPVSWPRVKQALDQVIDGSRAHVEQVSLQLVRGKITTAEWREIMAREMKSMHIASTIIARGGQDRMGAVEYGRVGGRLHSQYAYLDRFVQQIENGVQSLDQRLVSRALQYSNATRGTYESQRRANMREDGYTLERRVLHGLEHCDECAALARLGWQPIGSLPGIGDADCRANCRCTFEYR